MRVLIPQPLGWAKGTRPSKNGGFQGATHLCIKLTAQNQQRKGYIFDILFSFKFRWLSACGFSLLSLAIVLVGCCRCLVVFGCSCRMIECIQ